MPLVMHNPARLNFARDLVDSADPASLALVAIGRDGTRSEHSFGDVSDRAGRLAGTLAASGVGTRRRGDDAGRQPARVGLRAARLLADRRGRAALHRAAAAEQTWRSGSTIAGPRAVVVDERNAELLDAALATGGSADPPVADDPRRAALRRRPRPGRRPRRRGPGADHLHLRDLRRAEADPPRRSATWPASTSRPSTGSAPGRATSAWCTAASGWSKSARNVVRRAVAARRRRAPARRPLRPRRAARHRRARAA